MILNRPGQSYRCGPKVFTVGAAVYANAVSEYDGLFGVVTEIRDGDDLETENDGPDIYCEFQPPQTVRRVRQFEARFSKLYQRPVALESITLDFVIMSADMLEPVAAKSPTDDGMCYLLVYTSYIAGEDSYVDYVTLGVSQYVGILLRRMLDDVQSHETELVLSHSEEDEDRLFFAYEPKNLEDDVYANYEISRIPAYFSCGGESA